MEINDNYNKPSIQVSLPNSGAILTLGIISVISICCCLWPVGIILAIVALVMAPKAKSNYLNNQDLYTQSSYSNVKAGQTCAIIGLVINVLLLIYFMFLSSISQEMIGIIDIFEGTWNQQSY